MTMNTQNPSTAAADVTVEAGENFINATKIQLNVDALAASIVKERTAKVQAEAEVVLKKVLDSNRDNQIGIDKRVKAIELNNKFLADLQAGIVDGSINSKTTLAALVAANAQVAKL